MSAGPPAIARDATIMAMDGDKMRMIRPGKNEFTCVPDDPSSPGNDPMCLDKNAMEWLMAFLDHKDAPKGKMGLVYMLQGGSDSSNYDPFATRTETRRQMGDDRSARDGGRDGRDAR